MSAFYYYLVLINAGVSLAVALAVFWKNRYQPVGPLFGIAMGINAVWLIGFAQYFRSIEPATASLWAKTTLAASLASQPFLFHSMIALVGRMRAFRWCIAGAYIVTLFFLAVLWSGGIVTMASSPLFLHDYVHFSRAWYPFPGAFYLLCQWSGIGVLAYTALRVRGYKRTQLIYFIAAWLIAFLATDSIVLPLEYETNIQPFGFFVLPLNLGILAYVMTQARLMEINLAVGRVVIFVATLAAVMLVVLAVISVVNQIDPRFLGGAQTLFIVGLVTAVSGVLACTLPRFGSYAQHMLQYRLFGDRYRYQQAVSELTSEVATIPNADQLPQLVVDKLIELMRIANALVIMQEDATTDFVLRSRASLQPVNGAAVWLPETSEIIQWIRRNKRSLLKEEVQLREPRSRVTAILTELDQLKASLCVPMIVDNQLMGILALDNRLSGAMFVEQDIKLLEGLCAEIALRMRYRKFELQMLQTSKLASLGTLAAGIAHEIRNPLSSIKTFVQLLPTRPNDLEFQAEFSQLVSHDVDRISKIIENVLSFARSTSITVHEQSVEGILDDCLALLKTKFKTKRIELVKEIGQAPPVKVDKDQMLQVFLNILLNAVEALPDDGGKICISCSTSMLAAPQDNRLRKRQYLTIEIADNGPGIPDNIKGRLFEPFFTTKPQGTGLGLAICYKVVEVHGGFITIDSTEGKGTAFLVRLPV